MSLPHSFDPQAVAGQALASRLPIAACASFAPAVSDGIRRGRRASWKAEAVG